jgi:hypothetical protein
MPDLKSRSAQIQPDSECVLPVIPGKFWGEFDLEVK